MASKYFNEMLQKASPESKVFTNMSFDIIDRVQHILECKGSNQRELARKLGKSESEISKWLSVGHNMTLKTLAKITVALDETVIETPTKWSSNSNGDENAKVIPFRSLRDSKPGNRYVKFN